MKNILRNAGFLGASLMVLGAFAEGPAAGQGPVLSFGGSITGAGVGVDQKVRLPGNPPAVTFISKGNLVMNVGGASHNNIGYGAVGVLNFDRAKSVSDRIDEVYVYLNHDCIGNVKIGDTEGVTSTMMYTGDDVLGGLGGTSGDLDKLINMTRTVAFRPTIGDPANPNATKIVWISPEVYGFQIGLDFTPSTKLYGRLNRGTQNNVGLTTIRNASIAPYSYNLLAGGLSYNKAFTSFNLGLYLVGQTGKSKNDNIAATTAAGSGNIFKDTTGYQIGTLLDYQNWQFAASYFNNNRSRVRSNNLITRANTNTRGVNAAVGYDFARNANIALGYTYADRKTEGGRAKADVTMLTMDYVVAPGWVAFAEVDYFDLRAPAAAIADAGTNLLQTGVDIYSDSTVLNANNRGTAVILGTKLRF